MFVHPDAVKIELVSTKYYLAEASTCCQCGVRWLALALASLRSSHKRQVGPHTDSITSLIHKIYMIKMLKAILLR